VKPLVCIPNTDEPHLRTLTCIDTGFGVYMAEVRYAGTDEMCTWILALGARVARLARLAKLTGAEQPLDEFMGYLDVLKRLYDYMCKEDGGE